MFSFDLENTLETFVRVCLKEDKVRGKLRRRVRNKEQGQRSNSEGKKLKRKRSVSVSYVGFVQSGCARTGSHSMNVIKTNACLWSPTSKIGRTVPDQG